MLTAGAVGVLMLVGLIMRGVAFDFRVKARSDQKPLWNRVFFAGSLTAALAQGYMLGLMVMGFADGWGAHLFAVLIAGCLAAGYALIGAAWLIIKTEGALQRKAVRWAHRALWLTALGVVAISLATPLLSERIFAKWFHLPWIVLLAPIPLATAALFLWIERTLRRLPGRLAVGDERGTFIPFGATIGIMLLAFCGLAYSLFPYLVVDEISIWDAAAAPESLMIIFIGAAVVLPMIIGYTVFAYRVFGGKVRDLRYD
ncbi:MAG TPA: cytochrome d ubiquinol oxidase subunit II [Xanthomonadaceae bacterium]|nr:cytochrome d ubiquinol oxidase subunit II [Xanthomonadaceae bacterium]